MQPGAGGRVARCRGRGRRGAGLAVARPMLWLTAMTFDYVLGLAAAIGVTAYLVYALVRPERF